MIRNIVQDINDQLDYSFKDVLLGIVHPHDNKGSLIPMTSDGTMRDAVPDSSKKSIGYWEDYGSRTLTRTKRYKFMEHSLRFVMWLNFSRIASSYEDCVSELISGFPPHIGNTFIYMEGQLAKSNEIFARYNYQSRKQYITYPYDAIAFTIKVKYAITC